MAWNGPRPGVNLELFVIQVVRQIHELASSRVHKELRERCQHLLGTCRRRACRQGGLAGARCPLQLHV